MNLEIDLEKKIKIRINENDKKNFSIENNFLLTKNKIKNEDLIFEYKFSDLNEMKNIIQNCEQSVLKIVSNNFKISSNFLLLL